MLIQMLNKHVLSAKHAPGTVQGPIKRTPDPTLILLTLEENVKTHVHCLHDMPTKSWHAVMRRN